MVLDLLLSHSWSSHNKILVCLDPEGLFKSASKKHFFVFGGSPVRNFSWFLFGVGFGKDRKVCEKAFLGKKERTAPGGNFGVRNSKFLAFGGASIRKCWKAVSGHS